MLEQEIHQLVPHMLRREGLPVCSNPPANEAEIAAMDIAFVVAEVLIRFLEGVPGWQAWIVRMALRAFLTRRK